MKKLIYLLMLLCLSLTITAEQDECKGIITTSDIPCTIFLPVVEGCSGVTLNLYYEDIFLEAKDMGEYTPFYCNTTFDYTNTGTYLFNYSTLDTGSIIVEDDNMLDIFQLSVYAVMGALALIFLILMHVFKEDEGSPVVYGFIATAIFAIMGAMLLSGFEFIRGVSFFFDINYYMIGILFVMSMYTAIASINLFRQGTRKEVSPYD